MRWLKRNLLMILGFTALVLALIGVVLPLLPTTPFALLAAFLFSKSSVRMHNWLISLPKIGPSISNWNEYGVVDPKSKIIALALIFTSAAYIYLISGMAFPVRIIAVCILAGISVFLLTRPGAPQKEE